jgi:hypothetical protein
MKSIGFPVNIAIKLPIAATNLKEVTEVEIVFF